MSRRALVSALVALLVLAAGVGAVLWAPWSSEGAELTVEVEAGGPLVAGQAATWRVRLVNAGDDPVTMTFPSSLVADVALRRDGREVFRASDELVPTPRAHTLEVRPGASDFPVSVSALDVTPGTYEAVASVNGQPAPRAGRFEVVVLPRPERGR